MSDIDITGYRYTQAGLGHSHSYLLPTVLQLLDKLALPAGEKRLFELGCGNGSVANELTRRGWDVTGVDPSIEGIQQARTAYPDL
ncbi:MAG: methyltransferase domain-containing protein, partial [Candidatus Competibacteraceae bacterium]|nr:methyltransferase domain-containing protein [Candidatus Competibacteraceae bacterium]